MSARSAQPACATCAHWHDGTLISAKDSAGDKAFGECRRQPPRMLQVLMHGRVILPPIQYGAGSEKDVELVIQDATRFPITHRASGCGEYATPSTASAPATEDPHRGWLDERNQLAQRINSRAVSGSAADEAADRLHNLEDLIFETPAATFAAVIDKAMLLLTFMDEGSVPLPETTAAVLAEARALGALGDPA